MPIFGMLAGALLGALLGRQFDSILTGAFIGLIAGLVFNALKRSTPTGLVPLAGGLRPGSDAARIAALERRLDEVEAALARAGLKATATVSSGAPAATTTVPPTATVTAAAVTAPMAAARTASPFVDIRASASLPAYLAAEADRPRVSWSWITGGNAPARTGVVVLFIGVGFLLKYAAEHVSIPPSLRVVGVAVGGVALLAIGWALHEKRAAYATILQGTGIGVLYLAAFTALKLYALIPAPATFVLLVMIAVLSGVLAVRQDAASLAVAGALGGFLAPILTSSPLGSHVILFSYYALLDAGILGIAWFKAWRPLNLLGFVATFVVGTLWGIASYHAADFATTEPFLVLFFLFYVGIGLLYALRRSVELRHYVDGTIVFGTPVLVAGLQQALVRPWEYGMAISALMASTLYFALAWILRRKPRDELRLLTEAFIALGAAFAILAVPLAFDARWTAATWALAGAAIAWIGVRQRRWVTRAFGVILQVAAGAAFAVGAPSTWDRLHDAPLPILNGDFVGALVVALAGLATALACSRSAAALRPFERALLPVVFGWGLAWWALSGGDEIGRFVSLSWQPAAWIGFATISAIALAVAARRLAWPMADVAALLLGPALLVTALVSAMPAWSLEPHPLLHPFGHGGIVAWPGAIAAFALLLHRFERTRGFATAAGTAAGTATAPVAGTDAARRVLRLGHSVLLWLMAFVAANELAWLAAHFLPPESVWPVVPWGLMPALFLACACMLARRAAWPVASDPRAWLWVGAAPLLLIMFFWSCVIGIGSDGNPAPLPYVPLMNPVDLTLSAIAVAFAIWRRQLVREGFDVRASLPPAALVGVPAGLLFLWVTATSLRTIAHWFAVAWSVEAMWHSTLVQAVLSLLWTVIALATMVGANRRAVRAGWMAGAALLAVVVAKLFVVDLSRIGSVERIVSFIGVGLLLLLIGYLAPVPPRHRSET